VHPKFRGRDKWKLLLLCSVLHSIADNCFATSLYDPRTDKYVVGRKGAVIHAIHSLPQKLPPGKLAYEQSVGTTKQFRFINLNIIFDF
jgi:hypothetical protein